ncbi:MAG: membrane dipeptidase [Simkaniaceae bacterium]
MKYPIIDLHCDLLSYLAADQSRTPYDTQVPCNLSFLRKGQVQIQTMALFTETGKRSNELGDKQAQIYEKLKESAASALGLIPAIENASTLACEETPLSEALDKLEKWHTKIGPFLYLSLTWNGENRFGGGTHTKIGLKEEGKCLLEKMEELKIAIDLSHACDYLAFDIINFREKKGFSTPLIASHSNFRDVIPMERNLKKEFALAIKEAKGLIGLNLFVPFLGPSTSFITKHIEKALQLNLEDCLAIGADYFYMENASTLLKTYPIKNPYPKEVENASLYQNLIPYLPPSLALKITSLNAQNFLYRNNFKN